MTISPPRGLLGVQDPRVLTRPPFQSEAAGLEAIELAESVGLLLDPWQQLFVRVAMAETAAGQWAAREVGQLVARQNGKGASFEAIFLHGLFLDERMLLQLWTAHQFKTSTEAFLRIRGWIDGSDDLRRRVKRVNAAHGEEGFELFDGSRLRFVARSKSSGRGFSPQRIGLDEAQELSDAAYSAMIPSMSAQAAKHILYAGTVPDPEVNHPEVFTRVRDRGRSGRSPRLAWLEWTPKGSDDPVTAQAVDVLDRATWELANPALGIRLFEDTIEDELDSMDREAFRRERLSIWPTLPADALSVLPGWSSCATATSPPPVEAIGVAVSLDAEWGSIGAAGKWPDGRVNGGAVERRRGTAWLVVEAKRIQNERRCEVVVDEKCPDASLIAALEDAGVRVTVAKLNDYIEACSDLVNRVKACTFTHGDTDELNAAVDGAAWRMVGDRRVWGRKQSASDISMLEAVTLAVYAAVKTKAVPLAAWR